MDSYRKIVQKLSRDSETRPVIKESAIPDWVQVANTPRKFILHLTKAKCQAAKEGKPIYTEDAKSDFKMIAFGCHGKLGPEPEKVAALMADTAEKEKINLLLVTGDNFYPDGVTSPNQVQFQTHFYNKFLKYGPLKDKLFVLGLGNHGHGLRDLAGIVDWSPSDPAVSTAIAANQVAHTYYRPVEMANGQMDFEFDPKKFKYLQETHIDLETLIENGFRWFMPSRFFLLDIPELNTQLYILDSNTFLRDYYHLSENLKQLLALYQKKEDTLRAEYDAFVKANDDLPSDEQVKLKERLSTQIITLKKQIDDLNNKISKYATNEPKQVRFFLNEYKENPSRRKLIGQHHPVYYSSGKRAKSPDTRHYLHDPEAIELGMLLELKSSPPFSVQTLLRRIFEKENIVPDLVIHSHDHATSVYYEEKGHCQVNVGGGGGSLHYRAEFGGVAKSPLYAGHGCAVIEMSGAQKGPILMKIKSIQGKEWIFSNKSVEPILDLKLIPSTDRPFILSIRKLIFDGCYQYFHEYSLYQKSPYLIRHLYALYRSDIQCGINVLNLLCEAKPISFIDLLEEIQALTRGADGLLGAINDQFFLSQSFAFMNRTFKANSLNDFIRAYKIVTRPATPATPGWEVVSRSFSELDMTEETGLQRARSASIPLAVLS